MLIIYVLPDRSASVAAVAVVAEDVCHCTILRGEEAAFDLDGLIERGRSLCSYD